MTRPSSLTTMRRKISYLGAAHGGTRHFEYMRLTSLMLVPLTLGFLWMVLSLVNKDYNGVRTYFSHPFPGIAMLLFIGVSLVHMMMGLKTIIEDYVHARPVREIALFANVSFCITMLVAAIYAIFRLSF